MILNYIKFVDRLSETEMFGRVSGLCLRSFHSRSLGTTAELPLFDPRQIYGCVHHVWMQLPKRHRAARKKFPLFTRRRTFVIIIRKVLLMQSLEHNAVKIWDFFLAGYSLGDTYEKFWKISFYMNGLKQNDDGKLHYNFGCFLAFERGKMKTCQKANRSLNTWEMGQKCNDAAENLSWIIKQLADLYHLRNCKGNEESSNFFFPHNIFFLPISSAHPLSLEYLIKISLETTPRKKVYLRFRTDNVRKLCQKSPALEFIPLIRRVFGLSAGFYFHRKILTCFFFN